MTGCMKTSRKIETHPVAGMFVVAILLIHLMPGLLSAATISGGTAIVGILTGDEIVVAADSKEVLVYSTEKKKSPISRATCKIFQTAKNIFHAAAGSTVVEDSPFSYTVESIISRAYKRSATPQETIKVAEEEIRYFFQASLQHSKREEPDEYNKHFASISRIELIFFGSNAGSLFMSTRIFQAIDRANSVFVGIEANDFVCPPNCGKGSVRYWTFGQNVVTKKYLSEQSSWTAGPFKAAERAIELAIKASPNTIGPPIDIVGLSRTGFPSIRLKKQCIKA